MDALGAMPMTRPAAPDAMLGLRAREHSRLAVGTDHHDGLTRRGEAADLRRRAGDVEHGERDVVGDIAGKLRKDAALEEDGGSRDPDASGRQIDRVDRRNFQGRELSETSDAMRSPSRRSPLPARADPISRTRPMNMPPLPVTGL